jgi:hypothetical protein
MYFYRRSIIDRGGNIVFVVYAVAPVPRRDGAEPAIFDTFVPRSQFKHYSAISRAKALALYPVLGDSKPRRRLSDPTRACRRVGLARAIGPSPVLGLRSSVGYEENSE